MAAILTKQFLKSKKQKKIVWIFSSCSTAGTYTFYWVCANGMHTPLRPMLFIGFVSQLYILGVNLVDGNRKEDTAKITKDATVFSSVF